MEILNNGIIIILSKNGLQKCKLRDIKLQKKSLQFKDIAKRNGSSKILRQYILNVANIKITYILIFSKHIFLFYRNHRKLRHSSIFH